MMPLLGRNLPAVEQLPAPSMERILMIGDGTFIRAFVGPLVQRLFRAGLFDGGVVMTPSRALQASAPPAARSDLAEQDYLYTVWTRGLAKGQMVDDLEVVTVVTRGIDPFKQWESFLACAEQATINIVISNTTELGIAYQPVPLPAHGAPALFPARLAAYLKRRYEFFGGASDAGMLILPCELIEDNGSRLREIVLRHAADWELGEGFARWVKASTTFADTLVDRIVTGFPHDAAMTAWQRLGFEDRRLVVAEPFSLWAITRDARAARLLPLDRLQQGAGAFFVDDLAPYRSQKVRMLNGLHTFVAAFGLLLGLSTVREAIEHPLLGALARRVAHDVIAPHSELDVETLRAYADTVFERFRNPFIVHALTAIMLNALSKFRVRLLPVLVRHADVHGRPSDELCACLAALLAIYRPGAIWQVVDDPEVMTIVSAAWQSAGGIKGVVSTILSSVRIWGQDLTVYDGLPDCVTRYVHAAIDGTIWQELTSAK